MAALEVDPDGTPSARLDADSHGSRSVRSCRAEVAMPAPIPEERRAAAVAEYRRRKAKAPKMGIAVVAREFGIGEASLKRWLWLDQEHGHVRAQRMGGHRWEKLTQEQRDEAVAMVLAEPTLRLYEVAARMSERAGFTVGEGVVRRALRKRGIGKRRLVKEARAAAPVQPTPGRYKAKHRRKPEDRPHRRAYPSDFTDAEWAVVGPLWEEHATAQPVDHELRDVLDAMRYVGATGCPWRYIPHDYPPHATVYAWFDRWSRDGSLEKVNAELRRMLRRAEGREDTPSLLIVDSQSVKMREGGAGCGYDGGKKVRGRKRHIAVDTLGLPWFAVVHPASIQDRDGMDLVLPDDLRERLPRIEQVLADAGYQGRAEVRLRERTGVPLRIARRRGDQTNGEWGEMDGPPPTRPAGFKPVPLRWIVERSFAWANRRRRLSSDFERTPAHSLAWFHHANQFSMVARIRR